MDISKKYTVKHLPVATGPNTWSVLNVDIFLNHEDGSQEKIGEYVRDYHAFYNTFLPFVQNGKEYALYSKNYSTTSVMSLPDCKHIADTSSGFCPVDYFVPNFDESVNCLKFYENELHLLKTTNRGEYDRIDFAGDELEKKIQQAEKEIESYKKDVSLIGTMALVSGCVWGDDGGGWKLTYLDLSKLEDGKIELKGIFGYFELPPVNLNLKDLIVWEEPHAISIPLNTTFYFDDEGKTGFTHYAFASLVPYDKSFEIVLTRGIRKPTDEEINKILLEINDTMDGHSDDAMNDLLREVYRQAWERGRRNIR